MTQHYYLMPCKRIMLSIMMSLCMLSCEKAHLQTIAELCEPNLDATSKMDEKAIKDFAAQATVAVLNATLEVPPYQYYTKEGWQQYVELYATGTKRYPTSVSYMGDILITRECLVEQQPGWIVTLPVRVKIHDPQAGILTQQYLVTHLIIRDKTNHLLVLRTEVRPPY